MGRAGKSLSLVEGGARGATLQTGRLGNQFANLAGQIARVHPIVGNLAGVLGNFAVGATMTVGILAGVAAVAVAYDKLTESSRKAMAQADKLSESYNRVARISALGIAGQQKADIEDINRGLEQHHKWLGFIIAARARLGAVGGLLGSDPGGHGAAITAGVSGRAAAEQERVNQIGLREAANNEKWAARQKENADAAVEAARKIAAETEKARLAAEKYAQIMTSIYGNLSNMGPMTSAERGAFRFGHADLDRDFRNESRQMGHNLTAEIMGQLPSGSMPSVAINDSLTKEQIRTQQKLGILTDDAEKNAEKISDAIWGSASMMAGTIVNALNIGGGGPGSQIGGTLGTGIGGILGGALGGPLGGKAGAMLGGIVGGVFGSALGGLFDSNKKAVNSNTDALNNNTAALLLNAPGGFKAQYYNNRASDPRMLYRSIEEEARRQAARGGKTGFALQASGA